MFPVVYIFFMTDKRKLLTVRNYQARMTTCLDRIHTIKQWSPHFLAKRYQTQSKLFQIWKNLHYFL